MPTVHAQYLEEFVNGLFVAAIWSDLRWTDDEREAGGGEAAYCLSEMTDESRTKLDKLSRLFIESNLTDINAYVRACEDGSRRGFDKGEGTPMEYAGHDAWLSAVGHGTGFWDRDLGALGDRLNEAAKTVFGRFEGSGLPYETSDNKVSFEG